MKFSIIIPVYNRPSEVDELLCSLAKIQFDDFDVIVVEDGSVDCCDVVVDRYRQDLNLKYYFKDNSGPGTTRNYGAERSVGDYLIFLDSDCIVPEGYFDAIIQELSVGYVDAFGGPDRAASNFTPIQKAINYSMTSFITTGGIRGRAKSIDKFFPRSFNMGISRALFNKLGGFADMRFGEDVDFSYRIVESGGVCRLFGDAWVYHKRRSNFRQFFKQVMNSGIARIVLSKKHKGTLKLVHLLPSMFVVGVVLGVLFSIFIPGLWSLFLLFIVVVFIDATARNRDVKVGLLSVVATVVQLSGYGVGFIKGLWEICLLGNDKYSAFKETFYE